MQTKPRRRFTVADTEIQWTTKTKRVRELRQDTFKGGGMMQTNSAEEFSYQPEYTVSRIKNGEEYIRDSFIQSNLGFITSTVTRMLGRTKNISEEFSMALQAFNEAIDRYEPGKNAAFYTFAEIVINRRVIDCIRKSNKFKSEYPYTFFDTDEEENRIEKTVPDKSNFTQKIEIQEEIMNFKANLLSYGITFADLVKLAPKHKDTKKLCINITKMLSDDQGLSGKLEKEKRLPVADIVGCFGLNRKTVEKHRKYIIALYLVIKSDMEVIKGYVDLTGKGV